MKKPRKQFKGSPKEYLKSFEPYQHCCCFEDIKSLEDEFKSKTVFFTFDQMYFIVSRKESRFISKDAKNSDCIYFSCNLYNITTNTTLVGTIHTWWTFGGPLGQKLYFAQLKTNDSSIHEYFTIIKEVL